MNYILGLNSEPLTKKVEFIDDEVGMIRGEYLCISQREYFTKESYNIYFINYLCNIANVYKNKDVYYRMTDLTSNQMNFLDGALNIFREKFYMDGYRGVRRSLKFRDELKLELTAFVDAWKKSKNLALLIPFVSELEEVLTIKEFLNNLGYTGKIGLMAETPAICITIKDVLEKVNIDRLVVGLNDLSSFTMASNRLLKSYNVNNKATYEMVKLLVENAKSFNVEIVLGGYIDENTAKYYENLGISKMIVHYHLLPKIFNHLDDGLYSKHYDTIRCKFKHYRDENESFLKGVPYLND